ncbi:ATP-binding protein [Paenibacillus sp. sgz500958]|uniref:ATP-binding protein n=1 Tax=Paenibacillus sp. sgz500958 TaxID=3242475 RepID=UPI0036D230BD
MNKLKVMRLYIVLSLISILVMGRVAAWMNPADPSLDLIEILTLLIGSLLLVASFRMKRVKSNPDPWLFGYLWFISASAFISLMQYHYDTMLLITILMMYFAVSQVISSLRQLRIYMIAILLELIIFVFFTGDIKQTVFSLVIFLTASVVIYLSTGKRLELIRTYQATESALRDMIAEKNLYERAVRDVGTGVIIADAQLPGRPVIYANSAFTKITGYTFDEVIGRNCNFLQGKDTKQETVELIRDSLRQNVRVNVEILNYRKNHEPFWNELVISALKDEKGITTHYIGLQTDVTERRQLMQSEQQSRNILEQVLQYLKDAVIVMRPEQMQLHPVMMNDAAIALFANLEHAVLPQLDAYKELIFSIISGNEAVEQEMQLEVEGVMRYYRCVISSLDDLIMLTFTDISAHKESEHQLLLNKEALERTNQSKDEFLAMISHEFRTPLNSIMGIAQLQENNELTSEEARILKNSSENLLYLVERILDYSAMENGGLHVEKLPFNLQLIGVELEAKYRSIIEQKSLEFRMKDEQLYDVRVIGDFRRLMQIAATLLENALKFTPRGFIEVVMAARPHRETGMLWLEIRIKDSGIGIPEEAEEDIFEPFFKLDPSSTRKYGGLGIGLAFSRKLVQTLGGTISYQSKQGEGSTFVVKLPFELSSPEDSGLLSARKLSILLAEDHIDNQNLFIAFLKKMDCRVDVAVNGVEAVKMFKEGFYNMVFMDIQMPMMDGYEATRKIRSWEIAEGLKPTAIIALTAHAFEEHRKACRDAGCTDFLEKPIFREQLFEMIRRYGHGELHEIGG